MRLIDANALISEIKKDTEKAIEQDDRVGSFWLGYIAGLVIKQPTAQTSTSELISRQEAIDALDKRFDNIPMEQTAEILMLRKDLRELPTIQPEVLACGNGELVATPEPHVGHWIWVAGELMCSECRTIYSDLYPDYDNSVACPHCGAKMKGERQK